MSTRRLWWVWLLIIWAACTPAASNEITVSYTSLLAFDAPVTQSLTGPTSANEWSFVAEAGRTITIDLQTQGIQPALTLRFGSQIITEAAAGSYPNSLTIRSIPLPSSGTYVIRLTQTGPESGTYTLLVEAAETTITATAPAASPSPTAALTTVQPTTAPDTNATTSPPLSGTAASDLPTPAGVLLHPFQAVAGRITYPGEVIRYTLFSRANSTISLGVTTTDPDLTPSLEVYAPSGDLLAQSERPTGSWAAAITGLVTPSTGAYVVFVAEATGRQTGEFNVSYGPGLTITETIQGSAAPDTTLTGLLDTPYMSQSWTVDLAVGDIISAAAVVEETGTLDPILSLIGPDGQVLYADDNSGGGRSAAIRRAIAPQSGPYRLTVSPANASAAAGTYTLIWRYDTQQPSP